MHRALLWTCLLTAFLPLLAGGCRKREASPHPTPAAATPTPPESTAGERADRSAIERLIDSFTQAVTAQDLDLAISLWTDDGVLMPANQPTVRGRAAIRAYYQKTWGGGSPQELHIRPRQIRVFGDRAALWGDFFFSGIDPESGEDYRGQGRYLLLLERQPDGGWAIAWSMDNGEPLPPPAAPDAAPPAP